jgi:small subunit ribosomal protein S14
MAKLSKIAKNEKIKRLVLAKLPSVMEYRKKLKDKKISAEEREKIYHEFMKRIPRKARGNQYRNRCQVTGRPRGNYRKFDMCRIKIREFAALGLIPGIKKASW